MVNILIFIFIFFPEIWVRFPDKIYITFVYNGKLLLKIRNPGPFLDVLSYCNTLSYGPELMLTFLACFVRFFSVKGNLSSLPVLKVLTSTSISEVGGFKTFAKTVGDKSRTALDQRRS